MNIEAIYTGLMISGLVMFILRSAVIEVLRKRLLLEKAGDPRWLFFSDVLPVRLLFLNDVRINAPQKALFKLFFAVWLVFLSMLFLLCLSFIVRL